MTHVWPTTRTPLFLAAGLALLLYSAYRSFFSRRPERLSLAFCGIAITWVGYHLSPCLAYAFGLTWSNVLLTPNYIDAGLAFSALSMLMLLVGYYGCRHLCAPKPVEPARLMPETIGVDPRWVVGLTLFVLLALPIITHGSESLWRADYGRSAHSWARAEQGLWEKLRHILTIAERIFSLLLACLASLVLLNPRRRTEARVLVGGGGLAASLLQGMHGFSRAAGLPFLVLAVLAVELRGRRGIWITAVSLVLAVTLSAVGLFGRKMYWPGIGNFLDAMVNPEVYRLADPWPEINIGGLNPLRGIDVWTTAAEAAKADNTATPERMKQFGWSLVPLPSQFIPSVSVGPNLTLWFGSWGASGKSTPALGELHYVLGWAGALLVAPMGAIYAWFDNRRWRRPGVAAMLCYFLCIGSIGISIQKASRPTTRAVLQAFALYGLAVLARRLRARQVGRSNGIPTDQRGRSTLPQGGDLPCD